MKSCTFFGHRDCPEGVLPALRAAVEQAILADGIDTFYVGHEGAFDRLVAKVLLEMVEKYAHIRFFVVLAYLPHVPLAENLQQKSILADGVERVPRRFAVLRRNEWMLARADGVIAYVVRSFGGAAVFLEKARRAGKLVCNLGDESAPNSLIF